MNFRLWRFESRRKHLTPRRAAAAAADAFVHHVHCAGSRPIRPVRTVRPVRRRRAAARRRCMSHSASGGRPGEPGSSPRAESGPPARSPAGVVQARCRWRQSESRVLSKTRHGRDCGFAIRSGPPRPRSHPPPGAHGTGGRPMSPHSHRRRGPKDVRALFPSQSRRPPGIRSPTLNRLPSR